MSSTGAGGSVPDPSCVVPDVEDVATSITVQPVPLTDADTPVIYVTDTTSARTNVALSLCTPTGPVMPTFGGIDSGKAPFVWHWVGSPLSPGDTQVIFRADPAGTVYRTARANVTTGRDSIGDGGAVAGLCENPVGNLIAHADFEEGMDGLVPMGWQVRNPDLPNGDCLASGTPGQHVFLSAGSPACGGNALAIDARGQWDCFAVQNYSDYDTIEGGLTYRISAAARAQGNAINASAWFIIGAQWLDGTDTVFGDVKNPKPIAAEMNDFDWQVVSFDVVAPVNARRVVIWLSAHYPGRVDYDNVSVVTVEP